MIRRFLLFLAIVGCARTALETCKKGGEYCLNHWDCCSNSCMSYLYKCSHIQAAKPPEFPLFQPPVEVPLSLNQLIEIVYKPLELQRSAGKSSYATTSRFGRQISPDETIAIQRTTSGPPTCLEIGEKCYFDNECCSSRCHGFLHKCVT